MVRLPVLVAVLLLTFLWVAPAGAFTPPELYVRLTHANSIDHTPVSDWMPLSSAPHLNWLGGYEIGYTFQSAPGSGNPQRAALQITAVPDGTPTQPNNGPYCTGGPGTVGAIVPVGIPIQFEGSGTYSVRVSVGPPTGGPNDCMNGSGTASSTGSFSADSPVAPVVVGSPLVFRLGKTPGGAFSGVRSPNPPGGDPETRCARDATVNPDGSVSGPLVAPAPNDGARGQIEEEDFVRPGAWTCVARGISSGYDDNLDTLISGTPWSAPLRLDVRSDFRRARGVISKPRSKRPRLRFTAEFPEVAAGGVGTFKVRRLARCRGKRFVFRAAGTSKGRFNSKGQATVRIKRGRPGYYIGILSFSGTRFYTKSTDPNPALLQVSRKHKLHYVPGQLFPQCPGFSP
jgi:hypothetical protein